MVVARALGSFTVSASPSLALTLLSSLPHGLKRLLKHQLSLTHSRKEDRGKIKGILHVAISFLKTLSNEDLE